MLEFAVAINEFPAHSGISDKESCRQKRRGRQDENLEKKRKHSRRQMCPQVGTKLRTERLSIAVLSFPNVCTITYIVFITPVYLSI